jgi:predicted nucleotidyltransferase
MMLDHIAADVEPLFDEHRFTEVLRDTVGLLDATGVPFLILGGIASSVHGRDRWTHDIDFFVKREDALRALDALGAGGYRTEKTFWDWLYKAWHPSDAHIDVDLIFRSSGGIRMDDEMLARAVPADFRGVELRVIPAEDLLVMKAVAHDEHMPRHWHDALGLVSRCGLDWDYVLRRARQAGARRVLSLLVYAQSNDLIVPNRVIEELFDAIYRA